MAVSPAKQAVHLLVRTGNQLVEQLAVAEEAAGLAKTVQAGHPRSSTGRTALVAGTLGLGTAVRSFAELAAFVRRWRCCYLGTPAAAERTLAVAERSPAAAERNPVGHIPRSLAVRAAHTAAGLPANTWYLAVVSTHSALTSALVFGYSQRAFVRIVVGVEVVALVYLASAAAVVGVAIAAAVVDTVGHPGPSVSHRVMVVADPCRLKRRGRCLGTCVKVVVRKGRVC